jgi:hypothetical protein
VVGFCTTRFSIKKFYVLLARVHLCTVWVSDIVAYIKTNRLRWAGHVILLEEQNLARGVLVAVVEGRKQMGGRREGRRQEAGGEKLEECCEEQGQLAEASKEGLGSEWAVVPMIMMGLGTSSDCFRIEY